MKKLMIAAAIVCAAAFAQAASVTWTSSSSKYVDKAGNVITAVPSGSIVLAIISDSTGWSDGTWSGTSSTVTELQTASIGTSSKTKGKVNMDYDVAYGTASQLIKDGDVLAVVYNDGKGNYQQLLYQADEKAVTDTLTVSGLASAGTLYSETLTFASSGNFMTVPEPTSGLLLLLGVAGMALRCRRA